MKISRPRWKHYDKPQKGQIEEIYIKLTNNRVRRMGKTIQGFCPFHEERTPSFAMYPETKSAFCFACGWAGDTLKMIMDYQKISFPEALEFVRLL